jgi:hypothetical protein
VFLLECNEELDLWSFNLDTRSELRPWRRRQEGNVPQ